MKLRKKLRKRQSEKGENMKLLIIGAGGHGKVVAEIARDCGFEETAFLDDFSSEAIGKTEDIEKLRDSFEYAFVGIGNNEIRKNLIERLKKADYSVPTIIHPTAYISPSAEIKYGTVVEPKAIVNANSHIGVGCIISVGAIVDHDVTVGDCAHINSGSVVKAGAKIDSFIKIEAGEIVLGYPQAVVKKIIQTVDNTV